MKMIKSSYLIRRANNPYQNPIENYRFFSGLSNCTYNTWIITDKHYCDNHIFTCFIDQNISQIMKLLQINVTKKKIKKDFVCSEQNEKYSTLSIFLSPNKKYIQGLITCHKQAFMKNNVVYQFFICYQIRNYQTNEEFFHMVFTRYHIYKNK